jgi:hypothetical protein
MGPATSPLQAHNLEQMKRNPDPPILGKNHPLFHWTERGLRGSRYDNSFSRHETHDGGRFETACASFRTGHAFHFA